MPELATDVHDVISRIWQDLAGRPGGPFSFRFVLQPVMASLLAVRDGIKDASTGRSPYFWTVLWDAKARSDRLREGVLATARIIALGLAIDAIYQLKVFGAFRPVEAVVVALGLAFVPYLLIRGPAARLAHWWQKRSTGSDHKLRRRP